MLCVNGETITIIMIELLMFSYNFAYTIYCIKKTESKQASIQRKIH